MWLSVRKHLNLTPVRNLIWSGRKLQAHMIEKRLNIETGGFIGLRSDDLGQHGDAASYEPMAYSVMRKYAAVLKPTSQDVVYDIGCGLGRVLFFFATLGVKECVGLEISKELVDLAQQNVQKYRGRPCTFRIVLADAAEADYSQGTIYWMYNPFGDVTMRVVLERIRATLQTQPRPIKILYANPRVEHVLEEAKWLKCISRLNPVLATRGASIWTNK